MAKKKNEQKNTNTPRVTNNSGSSFANTPSRSEALLGSIASRGNAYLRPEQQNPNESASYNEFRSYQEPAYIRQQKANDALRFNLTNGNDMFKQYPQYQGYNELQNLRTFNPGQNTVKRIQLENEKNKLSQENDELQKTLRPIQAYAGMENAVLPNDANDIKYKATTNKINQNNSSIETINNQLRMMDVEEGLQYISGEEYNKYTSPEFTKKLTYENGELYRESEGKYTSEDSFYRAEDMAAGGERTPEYFALFNDLKKKGMSDSQAESLIYYFSTVGNENRRNQTAKNARENRRNGAENFLRQVGGSTITGIDNLVELLQDYNYDDSYVARQTGASFTDRLAAENEATTENYGTVGKFAYDTAEGLAEMGAKLLIGGVAGGALGASTSAVTSGMFATDAVGNAYKTSRELGADRQTSLSNALATGIVNYFIYSKGIPSLINTNLGTLTDSILESSGSMMGITGATELARYTFDAGLLGKNGQIYQTYEKYLNAGYSDEEAKRQASKDIVYGFGKSIAQAGLIGAIMGTGKWAGNRVFNRGNALDYAEYEDTARTQAAEERLNELTPGTKPTDTEFFTDATSEAEAKKTYRTKSKELHPDVAETGNTEAFEKLKTEWEEVQKYFDGEVDPAEVAKIENEINAIRNEINKPFQEEFGMNWDEIQNYINENGWGSGLKLRLKSLKLSMERMFGPSAKPVTDAADNLAHEIILAETAAEENTSPVENPPAVPLNTEVDPLRAAAEEMTQAPEQPIEPLMAAAEEVSPEDAEIARRIEERLANGPQDNDLVRFDNEEPSYFRPEVEERLQRTFDDTIAELREKGEKYSKYIPLANKLANLYAAVDTYDYMDIDNENDEAVIDLAESIGKNEFGNIVEMLEEGMIEVEDGDRPDLQGEWYEDAQSALEEIKQIQKELSAPKKIDKPVSKVESTPVRRSALPDAVTMDAETLEKSVAGGTYKHNYLLDTETYDPTLGEGHVIEIVSTGFNSRKVIVEYDDVHTVETMDINNDLGMDPVSAAIYSYTSGMDYNAANAFVKNAPATDNPEMIDAYADKASQLIFNGMSQNGFEKALERTNLSNLISERAARELYNAGVLDRKNSEALRAKDNPGTIKGLTKGVDNLTPKVKKAETGAKSLVQETVKYNQSKGMQKQSSLKKHYELMKMVNDIYKKPASVKMNASLSVGKTPLIFTELFGIPQLNLVINPKHTFENLASESYAKAKGLHNKKAHYHDLGPDEWVKLLEKIEDPLAIYEYDVMTKNPRITLDLDGENAASIEFYSMNNTQDKSSRENHAAITIFPMDEGYLDDFPQLYEKTDSNNSEDPRQTLTSSMNNSNLFDSNIKQFKKEINQFLNTTGLINTFGPVKEQLSWMTEDGIPKADQKIALKGLDQMEKVISNGVTSQKAGNINTIALGITTDFAKKGYTDFRGKKLSKDPAKAAADLAEMHMIIRNPQFETFRMIYMKGEEIVGTEAVTSYLVDGSRTTTKDTWGEAIEDVADRMKRLGADGYYMLHNHPSGDPTPSKSADIPISNFYSEKVPGYKGHIVIDHNKYSFIDTDIEVTTGTTNNPDSVDFNNRVIDSPYLYKTINNPDVLGEMAVDLVHNPNKSVVVFSGNAGIRAMQEIDNRFIQSKDFSNYIKNRKREFGSADAFLLTTNGTDVEGLYADGTFRDIVSNEGYSAMETGVERKSVSEDSKVFRVGEETADLSKRNEEIDAKLKELNAQWDELNKQTREVIDSKEYKDWIGRISNASEEEIQNLLPQYQRWESGTNLAGNADKEKAIQDERRKLQSEQYQIQKQLHNELIDKYDQMPTEEVSKYVQKAIRKYGTTRNYEKASYLTTTGSLLDFSDGQRYRVKDHREISEILDMPNYAEYSDGLISFMNMGNIRMQTYGIDISKAPTDRQKSALRSFFNSLDGEVTVDFSDKKGNTVGSAEYSDGTASSRILSDIDKYFKTGELPENTYDEFAQFRYSMDAEPVEITDENRQDIINHIMTMDQAKLMIQMAFNQNDMKAWGYKDINQWLEEDGADTVGDYIENTYEVYDKYVSNDPYLREGDITVSEVVEAYLNKTLVSKQQSKTKRLDASKDTGFKDDRFYSPQQIDNAKELYSVASQRVNNSNRQEVTDARAKLLMFAHNKGAAEELGITQKELNQKLRNWSNYSSRAREISERINKDTSAENRWTGIENSTYINRANITDEDIEQMVHSIQGESNEYERKSIARTMLAIDTHTDWTGLDFEFVDVPDPNRKTVRGLHSSRDHKITVKHNAQNTVAHEMGHALDNLWGMEITGRNIYLSEVKDFEMKNVDGDQKQFVENFKEFIKSLNQSADVRSAYTQKDTETFARFIDQFVRWTERIATGSNYNLREYGDYNDKFTQSQYLEFAHLLQEKSMLDINTEMKPVSKPTGSNSNDPAVLFDLRNTEPVSSEVYDETKRKLYRKTARVEYLEQQIKALNQVNPSASSIIKMGRKFLKEINSDYSLEDLAYNVANVMRTANQSGFNNYKAVQSAFTTIAKAALKESINVDRELYDNTKPIRDDLKSTKMAPTEAQLQEIISKFDSWSNFRKAYPGLNFVKEPSAKTISLDEYYPSLAKNYPEYFSIETTGGDQITELLDAWDDIKAPNVTKGYAGNIDEAAQYYGEHLFNEFMKMPEINEKAQLTKEVIDARRAEDRRLMTQLQAKESRADTKKTISNIEKNVRSIVNKAYMNKVPLNIGKIAIEGIQPIIKTSRSIEDLKDNTLDALTKKQYSNVQAIIDKAVKMFTDDPTLDSERLEKGFRHWLDYKKEYSEVEKNDIFNIIKENLLDKLKISNDQLKKQNKLNNMIRMLTQFEHMDESNPYKDLYSAELYAKTNELAEIMEGNSLNSLSRKNLNKIEEIVTEINHVLNNITNFISDDKNEKIVDLVNTTVGQLRQQKRENAGRTKGIGAAIGNNINKYLLSYPRMINYITNYDPDSIIKQKFDQYEERRHVYNKDMMDGMKPLQDFIEADPKEYERHIGKAKGSIIKNAFTDKNGNPVDITRSQLVNLVLTLRDPHGYESTQKKGPTILDAEWLVKGNMKKATEYQHELNAFNEKTRARLEEMLTPYDIQMMNLLHNYTNTSKDIINETWMKYRGVPRAFNDNYWPMSRDKDYIPGLVSEGVKVDNRITRTSNLQERSTGASQPILIGQATDNYIRMVKNTALEDAFLLLNVDLNKLMKAQYHVSIPDSKEYETVSVQKAIKDTMGLDVAKMLQQYIDIHDNNSMSNGYDPFQEEMSKLQSNFSTAVLVGRLSTPIVQFGSYPIALAYMDADSLTKGVLTPASREEIDKYMPDIWARTQGDTSPEIKAIKNGYAQKIFEKILPDQLQFMNPYNTISSVDKWTVTALWPSAKYQVQKDHPELKVGSDEYYEEVVKLFRKANLNTQPQSSAEYKTGLQRSNNELAKALSIFKTQMFNQLGLMFDATNNLKAANQRAKKNATPENKQYQKEAKRYFNGAARGLVASVLMVSAFTVVAKFATNNTKGLRNEETGEIELGKAYRRIVAEKAVGTVLPVGGSELWSILNHNWYDVNPGTISLVNDAGNQLNKTISWLSKIITKEKSFNAADAAKQLETLTYAVSAVAGVPVENLATDVKALTYYMAKAFGVESLEKKLGYQLTNKQYYNQYYKALEEGDTEKTEELISDFASSSGISESEAYLKLNGGIDKNNYVDLNKAIREGNTSDMNKYVNALIEGGKSEKAIYDGINEGLRGEYVYEYYSGTDSKRLKANMLKAAEKLGVDPTEYAKKIDGWTSTNKVYDNLNKYIASGNVSAAKEEIYRLNTDKKKEESTILNSIEKVWKPYYVYLKNEGKSTSQIESTLASLAYYLDVDKTEYQNKMKAW